MAMAGVAAGVTVHYTSIATLSSSASTSSRNGQLRLALPPAVPRLRTQRCSTLEVWAISSNDFRPGTSIELDGAPWRVQEFLHVKPGKGAAFVRTKLRNYITGNTVERTFRAGESLDEATVVKDVKQHTYVDGDQYVFMDMVIDVDLPITVVVKVTDTDPGLKGDTAQGGTKPATVETGAVVNVPLFVNIGDAIQVDTRTGSYMSRA